jgi:hypothetical protein
VGQEGDQIDLVVKPREEEENNQIVLMEVVAKGEEHNQSD